MAGPAGDVELVDEAKAPTVDEEKAPTADDAEHGMACRKIVVDAGEHIVDAAHDAAKHVAGAAHDAAVLSKRLQQDFMGIADTESRAASRGRGACREPSTGDGRRHRRAA